MLLRSDAVVEWHLRGWGTIEVCDAKILGGRAMSEPRLETVPVRIPEPAHERQGSIFEVQTKLSRPEI